MRILFHTSIVIVLVSTSLLAQNPISTNFEASYLRLHDLYDASERKQGLREVDSLLNIYTNSSIEKSYLELFKIDFENKLNLNRDSLLTILDLKLSEQASHSNLIPRILYSKAAIQYSKNNLELSNALYHQSDSLFQIGKPPFIIDLLKLKIRRGANFVTLRKIDTALATLQNALDFYETNQLKDTANLALIHYELGRSYERKRNFDQNYFHWDRSLNLARQVLPNNHSLILRTQHAFSIYYNKIGDHKKALAYTDTVIKARTLKFGNGIKLLSIYRSRSNAFRRLNKKAESMEIIDSSLAIMKNNNHYEGITRSLNDKANLLSSLEKKVELYIEAINLCDQDPACDEINRSILYSNIAIPYVDRGDYHTALNYLLKSKAIEEADIPNFGYGLSWVYHSLMNIYEKIGEEEKIEFYARKALEIDRKYNSKNVQRIAFSISNLVQNLIKKEKYIEAEKLLLEAENLNQQREEIDHSYLAHTYAQRAFLEESRKNYPTAIVFRRKCLNAYEKAAGKQSDSYCNNLYLQANLFNLMNQPDSCNTALNHLLANIGFEFDAENNLDYKNVPQAHLWIAFKAFVRTINLEAKTNVDQRKYLENRIRIGIDLIKNLRSGFFFETSEIEFQHKVKELFNWASQEIFLAYEEEKEEKWLSLFFQCLEYSKSSAISKFYNIEKESISRLIPQKIVKRERSIVTKYETTLAQHFEAMNSNQIEKTDSLAILLFNLQKEKESFFDSLSTDYPQYYAERYKIKVLDFEEGKNLSKELQSTFILYMETDSSIYSLTLEGDEHQLYQFDKQRVYKQLDSLQFLLTNYSGASDETNFYNHLNQFNKIAHQLYVDLCLNNIDAEDLIIAPDGRLTNLPFDVLLKDKISEPKSYKVLPFILREKNISYISSISKYSQFLNFQSPPKEKKYVGFAPSYFADQKTGVSMRGTISSDLHYNKEEIQTAASYFKGETFTNQAATKHNFIENAKDSEILHLAMHAVVNDKIPLESYLLFTEQDSAAYNQNKLHTYEIAGMNLNNELVILTACETNRGELNQGEGIMGLARAFNLSLCPNIILSNWLMNDKASNQIMQAFFQELDKNQTSPDALRKAKLNYLNQATTINAHPSFWAGYSYYGNKDWKTRSLGFDSKTYWLIGTFLIIVLGYLFRKKLAS